MDKNNWTYKKLGEICNVINGLWVGKKEPFINIAVIRNTNFSKDCKLKLDDVAHIDAEERQFSTRKLQVGDIIIEKSGGSDKQPVGRPVLFNIPNSDYSFSNFTATLRLKENNFNPQFLHYCLFEHYRNGETKKMQSKTTGLRNLDMKAYLKLPIPNIELAEQERIVAELDLLSSIIDKKKAQLKELDQLAQSIFYDMFGDPITNEKGWEVKKLGEIGELQRGSGLSKKDLIENGFPCILYGQIHTKFGAYTKKHIACIPQDLVRTTKIAHFGDVIMAITSEDVEGSCKSVAWMGDYDIAIGSDAAIYRHNINGIYVSYYTQTKAFYFEKAKYAKGFKVTHISTKEIATIPIPLPPLPLQQEFADKVEAIERQKSLIQQSIDEVQTLFDSRMDYWFG